MLFRLYSGKEIDLFNLKQDEIEIEDIAHSLIKICRFGSHIPCFYSVAEHSIDVASEFSEPKLKLAGLLHDPQEAYLGADEISPKKACLYILKPDGNFVKYNDFENEIQEKILRKYRVYEVYKQNKSIIKQIDIEKRKIEAKLVRDPAFVLRRNADPDYFVNTYTQFMNIFNSCFK